MGVTHPGRLESFATGRRVACRDCGAEFVERRSGGESVLVCPWARLPVDVEAGEVSCGMAYQRPRKDQGMEYQRDQGRKSRP